MLMVRPGVRALQVTEDEYHNIQVQSHRCEFLSNFLELGVCICCTHPIRKVGNGVDEDCRTTIASSFPNIFFKRFPTKVLVEINHSNLVSNHFPCSVICLVIKLNLRVMEDSTSNFTSDEFIRLIVRLFGFCHEHLPPMLLDEMCCKSVEQFRLTHFYTSTDVNGLPQTYSSCHFVDVSPGPTIPPLGRFPRRLMDFSSPHDTGVLGFGRIESDCLVGSFSGLFENTIVCILLRKIDHCELWPDSENILNSLLPSLILIEHQGNIVTEVGFDFLHLLG